ncbi:heat stress transcription factor A-8 [Humulus lupulus]|uniref:heat stress transcription factor A-8 n=1 Tax=Humulus lupulus TaxID=3486 RepID=UPI002B4015E3|nr:heat stress transcription factor A-8 [Humulus lupulus]
MGKSSEIGDGGSGSAASIAPFLKKCYEMVNDESTDSIISWNDTNDSFVIWDMIQFSVGLLPKYFKHSNFSSFMRQLNIYGFRKIHPDRWMFANEGFIRDQKHLLKNICRRKHSHDPDQRKAHAHQQKEHHPEESDEKVKDVLWREVENLKIDKSALAQELVKLRQYQETADNKMLVLGDRLQGMEKNQQQMLSFLVMAVQSPGLFVQLLQPKENNWRMSEAGNMLEEVTEDDNPAASDGMIVRYLPSPNETLSPVFTSTSAAEKPSETSSYPDGTQDFFLNSDFMKILMDEKLSPLETHSQFILPELADDNSWEQLLLASPFRDNNKDPKDDEETNNTGMEDLTLSEIPPDDCRNFDYLEQMEPSHNFGMEPTVYEGQFELPHMESLETLNEQMGLLSSEPENNGAT